VWDKILFEGKATEKLSEAHVKQVLNYLATAKLRLGLLVNFGADSLEWSIASPPPNYNFHNIPVVQGRYHLWQAAANAPTVR